MTKVLRMFARPVVMRPFHVHAQSRREPGHREIVDSCFLHICRWLQDNAFIALINGTAWTAAILEIVHYFSLFILVGSMVIVDLRVLGLVGRRLQATQLADWLLPWIWISLAFNFLSGFLMFAGSAPSYYNNDVFYDKMAVVLLAVAADIFVLKKISKWDQLLVTPSMGEIIGRGFNLFVDCSNHCRSRGSCPDQRRIKRAKSTESYLWDLGE